MNNIQKHLNKVIQTLKDNSEDFSYCYDNYYQAERSYSACVLATGELTLLGFDPDVYLKLFDKSQEYKNEMARNLSIVQTLIHDELLKIGIEVQSDKIDLIRTCYIKVCVITNDNQYTYSPLN